jgi:hypothetical protein
VLVFSAIQETEDLSEVVESVGEGGPAFMGRLLISRLGNTNLESILSCYFLLKCKKGTVRVKKKKKEENSFFSKKNPRLNMICKKKKKVFSYVIYN